MKARHFLSIVSLLFLAIFTIPAFVSADITTGLIAHYNFGNDTFPNVTDSSGNGFNGTFTNASSTGYSYDAGIGNLPAILHIISDHSQYGQDLAINVTGFDLTGNYTISFLEYIAVGQGDTWFIDASVSNGMKIRVNPYGSLCMDNNDCIGQVNVNGWNLITLVRLTNGTYIYYKNGTYSITSIQADTRDFNGSYKWIGNIGNAWDIKFADIRFYNRALTASDAQEIYNADFSNGCNVYTGLQYVGGGLQINGCGSVSSNICGYNMQTDFCEYYPMTCGGIINTTYCAVVNFWGVYTVPWVCWNNASSIDYPSNAMNQSDRFFWCPRESNVSIDACMANNNQYLTFLQNWTSFGYHNQCGTDYCYIASANYRRVYCSDANCSLYPITAHIIFNSTSPFGTITDAKCVQDIYGGTSYEYSECSLGTWVSVGMNCGYGCSNAYGASNNYTSGCLPYNFSSIYSCFPNTVLHGDCIGDSAYQVVCNNYGTSNFTRTVACSANQYCSNGNCLNRNYGINETSTTTTSAGVSKNSVTSFLYSTNGVLVVLLYMAVAIVFYHTGEETIPLILFTAGNFLYALFGIYNPAQSGYLIGLVGLLVLFFILNPKQQQGQQQGLQQGAKT